MKLIDADELRKNMFDYAPPEMEWDRDDIEHKIGEMPTIDAIPVVKCKDCKHAYMTYGGECKYCDIWSEEGEMYLPGDFYCACGERKGERKIDDNH